jgi:hypothetical protein
MNNQIENGFMNSIIYYGIIIHKNEKPSMYLLHCNNI